MTPQEFQTEEHIYTLTKCGIHRDHARKIIAMTDGELTEAVVKFGAISNKTPVQTALVKAAQAEIDYRKDVDC